MRIKKIALGVISIVALFGGVAQADTCAKNLMPPFTAAQAKELCATFVGTTTISASLIPGANNSYDLGDATHGMRYIYIGGSNPIVAPTAINFAPGSAATPVVRLLKDELQPAATNAFSLGDSSNAFKELHLSNAFVYYSTVSGAPAFRMVPYVPTLAATPVAGTNDFRGGSNAVPTAAANTAGCLPTSPTNGDIVEIFNGMANAVRAKSCSTPGINGGAAGTYMTIPAWTRAKLKYSSTLTTWTASSETVPTPAGP